MAVQAQAKAVGRLDPPALGLKPGATALVSVRIEDVSDLYGVELHLSFDPQVIEVVDPKLQVGDWFKDGFTAVNKIDNTAGKIDFAATLLNPQAPIAGSGVVLTFTVQGKTIGSGTIHVDQGLLASRDGKEIPSAWQNTTVDVSTTGQAPADSQPAGSSPAVANTPPASAASGPDFTTIGIAAGAVVVFGGALIFLLYALRRK